MSEKYKVLDGIIKDELREFILWLEEEKKIKLCREEKLEGWQSLKEHYDYDDKEIVQFYPFYGANEDLINEYVEIK